MGATIEFAGVFYREGALDPKTTQLVALAAMAAGPRRLEHHQAH